MSKVSYDSYDGLRATIKADLQSEGVTNVDQKRPAYKKAVIALNPGCKNPAQVVHSLINDYYYARRS
jgi:hypothetical protein